MAGGTPAHSLFLLLIFIPAGFGLYENCDFYQQMETGKTYYVYSPKYPAKYQPGMSCRFYAVSPPGTNIDLYCEDILIPPSQDCMYDRLTVSKTGQMDLSDGINYCGRGTVRIRSDNNRMNIVGISAEHSPGGSFLCSIKAIPIERNCECGWTNQQRIVGGIEVGVNEYPMMAGLVDGSQRELYCGATIISQKFAITAAHCLLNKRPYKVALLVGDHDISTGNDTNSARLYLVDKFIIHPEYSTSTLTNDIAIVRVEKEIEFSKKVGPACLPFMNRGQSFVGEHVIALGWGGIRYGGINSERLLSVPLEVVPNRNCKKSYGDGVTDKQVCTYKEKKDTCQNDSGGPLLWKDHNTGRLKILGIVSYGIQCATKHPSVNTRVTSYVDWIQSRTGEEYCVL